MSAGAERGGLTVSERAVRRIAAQVVSEVGGVYGVAGGFLGLGGHADATERPDVDVQLSGTWVDVRIAVGLGYPTSVRAATARIRDDVKRRVHQMAGLDVHRVEIDVVLLHPATGLVARGKETLR